MVYAVGTPTNGSMRVIAHAAQLTADGTVKPATIKTGSAGLAPGAVGELAAARHGSRVGRSVVGRLAAALVWASQRFASGPDKAGVGRRPPREATVGTTPSPVGWSSP